MNKYEKTLKIYEAMNISARKAAIDEAKTGLDKRAFAEFINRIETEIDKKYSGDKNHGKYIKMIAEIDDDWEKLMNKVRTLTKAL